MSAGDALARLRQALEAHGSKISANGTSAQCPAHDDGQPSLSIGQGREGAILHCHADCETDAILEALGMSAADLFDQPRDGRDRDRPEVVDTYVYDDEHGKPLFYVERLSPKGFRQFRMVNGERVWSLRGVRRVPYRLPDVLAAAAAGETIYVTEGEKDADAIRAAGATATTGPGGAGKWRAAFADHFRGAGRVIIVADADKTGREHAAQVAESLDKVVPVIKIVEAAKGKDAYDHLAAGLTLADLVPSDTSDTSDSPGRGASLLTGMHDGAWLDKQEFAPLRYHVPGIIAEGVTVLAGAPKVGKSWLVLGCALAVAAPGSAFGKLWCEARPVFYLALEDGDRRLQERCRVLLGSKYRPRDPIPGAFTYLTRVRPGAVVATIGEYLDAHGKPGPLVIVDTLGKVLPPALLGETSYGRDYRIMTDLKDLTDAWPGTSLLISHHDRKAETPDFVDSVSGTNGIAGGADTVLVLARPRGESGGLLHVTGRDVTEDSYAVSFDRGAWTLDGGGGLDEAAATARARHATAGLAERSAEIVAYVIGRDEPVSPAQVANALGLDGDQAGKYLRRAVEAGRLTKTGYGLYAPVRSVRMSDSEAAEDGQP